MRCLIFISLVIALGNPSVSEAFQGYFDLDGVRYKGEVSIEKTVGTNCSKNYSGSIIITSPQNDEVLPVRGTLRLCAWVGPEFIPVEYFVTLPSGKSVRLYAELTEYRGASQSCYNNIPWSGCSGSCDYPSDASALENLINQVPEGCVRVSKFAYSKRDYIANPVGDRICLVSEASAKYDCSKRSQSPYND